MRTVAAVMLKCTPSWAAVSPYKYRRKNSSPSGGGSAMICAISSVSYTHLRNYLLMHPMGPNVAGVIGSAVAAGILINMCG